MNPIHHITTFHYENGKKESYLTKYNEPEYLQRAKITKLLDTITSQNKIDAIKRQNKK